VCGPVQVCWEKFARYFDVEIRQIPLRGDRLVMTPEDAAAHCDENTIMVVATFGQTFTGLFEDVAGISAALGPFDVIHGGDPRRGITAVSWRLAGDPGCNLYDLSDRMRIRGRLIAAYPLPADRQDETVMRAVIRHGFSHDMADLLLADLRRSLDHLAGHPPSAPLTHAEAGGFNHNATPAVNLATRT
jgi:glutamate/tyrosine decarboxylase-like PLP-dependent enzyme